MYEPYKTFIFSEEIFELVPWAKAVQNDRVDEFLELYDPYIDEEYRVFDPIELVIAFDAENIFQYLLNNMDYSHFYNHVDFSLLVLCVLFEREHFLLSALEKWVFSDEDKIAMYEYIIDYKDVDYFKQFYAHQPLHAKNLKRFLRIALNSHDVFLYLIELEPFKPLVFEEMIVFDVLSMHPELLDVLEPIDDLTQFLDTDVFQNVLSFESFEDFKKTTLFLLKRGWNINAYNAFGIPLIHMALRHAVHASYVDYLIEIGASMNVKTSMGYPSAHQLLMRDARFTLEVSHLIDFNAKDAYGYTLQDYDDMHRSDTLNIETVIRFVQCAFNMAEEAFYELNEEEFYDLGALHGFDLFTPYITLFEFESKRLKTLFIQTISEYDFDYYETTYFREMFQNKFNHDPVKTIQVMQDIVDLESDYTRLQAFVDQHSAPLIIESEGYDINKIGHMRILLRPNKPIQKRVTIHTNLLDVYFVHHYYNIPIQDITYEPMLKKTQRFLN